MEERGVGEEEEEAAGSKWLRRTSSNGAGWVLAFRFCHRFG